MIDRHCADKDCTEGEIADMLQKHLTNVLEVLDYALPTAIILPPTANEKVRGAREYLGQLVAGKLPVIRHYQTGQPFAITHVLVIDGPQEHKEEVKPFEMRCYAVEKLPKGFSIRLTWGDAFLEYKGRACSRHFYNLVKGIAPDKDKWTCWPFTDSHKSPEQDIVDILAERLAKNYEKMKGGKK